MSKRTLFDRAAYQREWSAHRVVDGTGVAELSVVEQLRRTAASTDAHLADLQSSGGAWKTLNIPAERPRFYFNQAIGSGCGSPAGMCAEVGME